MESPKVTDITLCKALYRQDKKAFDTIYERYWKRLYLYAYKIFEDQAVCEDMVQEVFVKLWQRAGCKQVDHLEAYLFRAVKYQARNAIRNLKKTTDLEEVFMHLPDQLAADLLLEGKETALIIEKSVNALPERCQEVFQLSRMEQLSNKEIAHQMNISVRTVEAHLYKALKSIKKNIGEIYFWITITFIIF